MNSQPCGACSILNQPCNAGCFWAQYIKVGEDEKFRVLLRGNLDASKVEELKNLIVNTRMGARQHYVDDLYNQILFESALAISGLNGVNLDFVLLFSQADIKTVLDLTKQHGKEWVERELLDVANGLVQSAKEDEKTKAEVLLISELFSEEDRIAIFYLTEQQGKEWVERKLLDALVQIAKEDEKAEAEVLLIGELFSEEGITAILDIAKQQGKEWVVSKLAYVVTDLVQKANSSASAIAVGDSAAYHWTSVSGDDVVIVAACRTPICEANCGSFKDTYANDLLAPVLKAVIEKTNVNLGEVGDIVVGTMSALGSQRATECRMAAFYAGFPETVPINIVDRQCSSGLQAIADVAAAIRAGFYDIGIGASLESMTSSPLVGEGLVNPKVESHQRAVAATASSKFKDEIIPMHANQGNSSRVSDGVRAVLLMKRSIAVQKGLPILGVFRTFAAVSTIMGVDPTVAIPAAVKDAGLELDDIDLFVINEAFASQFVACPSKLGLDPEKVNVNGGATGACCVATLLNEMKCRGKDCRFGVISSCTGSGMGTAAVFERGDAVDDLCNAQVVQSNSPLSKDAQ